VGSGSGEVGITSASKGTEVMVRGVGAVERKERSAHVQRCGGKPIEEEGSSSESISPVGRRHGSLKEESSGDIISGANHALGFPILLGCIRTRHTKGNAMGKKERTRGGVVKLTAVVTLYCFDGAAKLGYSQRKD
jgi:hypothetical protein